MGTSDHARIVALEQQVAVLTDALTFTMRELKKPIKVGHPLAATEPTQQIITLLDYYAVTKQHATKTQNGAGA